MSVKPLKRLYAGSPVGTFTYMPSSLSAAAVSDGFPPLLPSWCAQNPASALRKRCSPTRSSRKPAPFEVTDPVPPSDLRRMSRVKVVPLETTVPESRTVGAVSAAFFAFAWMAAADSLPTPFVPASGSPLPHPVSPVPVTTSAHIAATVMALRVRPWGNTVTGGAASRTRSSNGVRQRTGAAPAWRRQSVRTAHQGVPDRDGLA